MKTDKGGSIIKKINWKWIFPIIHMVISFLYMTFGFKHDPLPFGEMTAAYPVNWSEDSERLVYIIMSYVLGISLVCITWYVFFLLIKRKKKIPFLLIFISFIIAFVVFPANFSAYEPDNMLVYSYALRNMPDYWQSIYLGCLYKAYLFVFPHPFMVSFIQLSVLFGILYYISTRVKRLFGRKLAFIPYLTILFPEFMELGVSPYRNCIYTIMCLWFYALLFFDCLEKKKRSARELILISLAGGFLTVFRSEGIIVFGILIVAFCFIYRMNFRRICKYFIFSFFIYLLLMFPQKLGERKYYGQDYSMINSMNMLKTIVSDKNVNLKFDSAEEDLMAIHTIVPLKELPTYGIHGYRAYNFVKNGTINQSFATKAESQAFMRSVRNLIFYNPGLFLKDRMVMFCEANGISGVREEPYPTEAFSLMYAVLIGEWNYSYEEIVGTSFPKTFFSNQQKINLANDIVEIGDAYYKMACKSKLVFISRILVFVTFPILVIYDIKLGAKKERTFFGLSAFLLWGQLIAIILLCPEGRNVYYFPSYFVMLLGCFLLTLDIIKKSKQVKTMLPPVISRL